MQLGTHCVSCHAPLTPNATACAYCKAPTPFSVYAAAQQQAFAAQTGAQRAALNLRTISQNATWALILTVLGIPLCCAPASLVGGVLGWRAAKLAKAEHVAVPTQAIAAMALCLAGLLSSGVLITMFVRDTHEKAERLAAVQARLSGRREAAVLDVKLACDLVEERLLERGLDDKANWGAVRCDGAPETLGGRAVMRHVRAVYASKTYDITACLARSSSWYVDRLTYQGSCDAPDAVASAGSRARSEDRARAAPSARPASD